MARNMNGSNSKNASTQSSQNVSANAYQNASDVRNAYSPVAKDPQNKALAGVGIPINELV